MTSTGPLSERLSQDPASPVHPATLETMESNTCSY